MRAYPESKIPHKESPSVWFGVLLRSLRGGWERNSCQDATFEYAIVRICVERVIGSPIARTACFDKGSFCIQEKGRSEQMAGHGSRNVRQDQNIRAQEKRQCGLGGAIGREEFLIALPRPGQRGQFFLPIPEHETIYVVHQSQALAIRGKGQASQVNCFCAPQLMIFLPTKHFNKLTSLRIKSLRKF